jgi:hypothetical protein
MDCRELEDDMARWASRTALAGGRIGAAALACVLMVGLATSSAGASAASDKAQAKKALLVLGDMPKGWTSTKSSGGGNKNLLGAKQLANCIGIKSSVVEANPPQVESPDFHSADQTYEVDDQISIFPSVSKAKAELAAVSNTKTPGCMTRILNGSYKSQIESSGGGGTKVGIITVARGTSTPGTVAFVIGIPITAQGQSVQAHLTVVYFLHGKLGQEIVYYDFGTAFPTSLMAHLTSVAIHRL